MRMKLAATVAAFLSLTGAGPTFGAQPTAAGLWQAVDDDTGEPTGWFLIAEHGGVYAGSIAKMFMKPGENPAIVCDQCADDRHNKPWLGLEIIRGMKQQGSKYEDGTILDPRNGRVYSAEMTLSPDGQALVVRGYFGISLLGKNQYWKRLPDSAYNELDPSINPKQPPGAPDSSTNPKQPPGARKSDSAPKPDSTTRH